MDRFIKAVIGNPKQKKGFEIELPVEFLDYNSEVLALKFTGNPSLLTKTPEQWLKIANKEGFLYEAFKSVIDF